MEGFGDTNVILFAHVEAHDLVRYDLAKAQQLSTPPTDGIGFVEAGNHNISPMVRLLSRRCKCHRAEDLSKLTDFASHSKQFMLYAVFLEISGFQ